ncbi:MAG: BglII/BstYI family type II restriction endonuclease [Candidatus Dadabacteria bacterium]
MTWKDHIPSDIAELYEVHDYKHAAAILAKEFPNEFEELCTALRKFRLSIGDITLAGGNESLIPKKFSKILRPMNWAPGNLKAKLVVDDKEIKLETHKVDYIKGRVAFDLEWNSKDQTFDRDLYAFRAFYEYDKISLGVLVTRSNSLDALFDSLGSYTDKKGDIRKYKSKYGASTTHMGKLLPRLDAGRNGGCPILVFGITTKLLANESETIEQPEEI